MDEKIRIIVEAMQSVGYDVRAQLTGYLLTGNKAYITRKNNARELICTLDKTVVKAFAESLPKE